MRGTGTSSSKGAIQETKLQDDDVTLREDINGPDLDRPKKRRRTSKVPPSVAVSADLRSSMIAESAYYRAERRAFAPGYELEDWLAAEREVDERIGIPTEIAT